MIHPFRRLESWWWSVSHPEWDEPERDETTPQLIRDWIASHRHPAECSVGCQCERGSGVT